MGYDTKENVQRYFKMFDHDIKNMLYNIMYS